MKGQRSKKGFLLEGMGKLQIAVSTARNAVSIDGMHSSAQDIHISVTHFAGLMSGPR